MSIVEQIRALFEEFQNKSRKMSDAAKRRELIDAFGRAGTLAKDDPAALPTLRAHTAAIGNPSDPWEQDWVAFLNGILFVSPDLLTEDPDAFYEHPAVQVSPEVLAPRTAWAFGRDALAALHEDIDEPAVSHVGGVPLTTTPDASWPRRSDGVTLPLALQLEVENYGGDVADFPLEGVLQIFHDLETRGAAPTDDPTAWAVRYLEPTDEFEIAANFPTLATPNGHEPLPATPLAVVQTPTVRHDLPAEHLHSSDAYVALTEAFETASRTVVFSFDDNAPHNPQPGEPETNTCRPVSRVGGYPGRPLNDPQRALLHTTLPLASSTDEHTLLAELDPNAFSADWFAGHPLQVWIRRSDLHAANFDHTWAFVRDDR